MLRNHTAWPKGRVHKFSGATLSQGNGDDIYRDRDHRCILANIDVI